MKKKILVLLLTVFIVGGFLLGIIIPKDALGFCTNMGCSCGSDLKNKEMSCNSCGVSDPVFITGLINVFRSYNGTEMIICENGKNIGSRIEINKETGLIKANILLIPVYPIKDFKYFLKNLYRDFFRENKNIEVPAL